MRWLLKWISVQLWQLVCLLVCRKEVLESVAELPLSPPALVRQAAAFHAPSATEALSSHPSSAPNSGTLTSSRRRREQDRSFRPINPVSTILTPPEEAISPWDSTN
ncbi:MAG: hypothetical protein [Cressdnaviricota sp.]|nr:MAG: hypothetical protein [Cressdnaviricota sp.]